MKITCPSCATRYDVDDDRFLPDGRSVRCAECDESWFVPAPDPVEDLTPLRSRRNAPTSRSRREMHDYDDDVIVDEDLPRRSKSSARSDTRVDDVDEDASLADDFLEDALFDDPRPSRSSRSAAKPPRQTAYDDDADFEGDDYEDERHRRSAGASKPSRARRDDVEDPRDDDSDNDDDLQLLPPRDEKGRFIKVKRDDKSSKSKTSQSASDDNDDVIEVPWPERHRPKFKIKADEFDDDDDGEWRPDRKSRLRAASGDDRQRGGTSPREKDRLRASRHNEDHDGRDYAERAPRRAAARDAEYRDIENPRGRRARYEEPEARVVDADFEDIDDVEYFPGDKGFGRKMREERRRSTALARVEDLEPVIDQVFKEEFFAALNLQPRELERAIRKARRRAEARNKNRLTPLSIFGWSAFLGVVTASLFVSYAYRDQIVAFFPNAAEAYEVVGIEAAPFGLKIENVAHRVAMSTTGPTIEISGELRNSGQAAVAPPLMQAEAFGSRGELLSRWTFTAEADEIGSAQSVTFSTRAPAPEGVAEVALSFAPAEGVRVSVGDLLTPASEN